MQGETTMFSILKWNKIITSFDRKEDLSKERDHNVLYFKMNYICSWTALYNFANNVWTNLISESTTPLYIQVMKVPSWYLHVYVLFIVTHSFDRDKYPVYGSYHVGWGSKLCSKIVVSFFLKTLLMMEI